jgi:hypothetical protein
MTWLHLESLNGCASKVRITLVWPLYRCSWLLALWYGHEHVGRFSQKFLLEMPLWAQSYPGSPLSVALLVQTMMRLGLRQDLSIHLQPLRDAAFTRLQNRPMVLGSMVKLVASFAP